MRNRTANIDEIYKLTEEIAAQRTTDEWMEVLSEANVPCMRVHTSGKRFAGSADQGYRLC